MTDEPERDTLHSCCRPVPLVGQIHINRVKLDEMFGLYVVASAYELLNRTPLADGDTAVRVPTL